MKRHIITLTLLSVLAAPAWGDVVCRTHEIIGFVNFDFNSTSISDVERQKIDYLMAKSDIPYDAQIVLTGHTDAPGGEQYNYQLGLGRALNTAKYMNQYKHEGAPQIVVNSEGEMKLIWWTKKPERINRRVDLKATWVEEK